MTEHVKRHPFFSLSNPDQSMHNQARSITMRFFWACMIGCFATSTNALTTPSRNAIVSSTPLNHGDTDNDLVIFSSSLPASNASLEIIWTIGLWLPGTLVGDCV